jgi:HAMP domain-containing protein
MKWNSIRTKVLGTLAACLALSLGGTLALLQYSFGRNTHAVATEAVSGAHRLFGILEARETSKMIAVGQTLARNPDVREAFAAKDRKRLLQSVQPLYPELKAEGITNWMFHAAEPDMSVFLRVHNPPRFGDHLNRFMDKQVVATHNVVTGNELGRAGFAVRMIRPFYAADGALSGYLEFGEEIGQFMQQMKSQTGDDYGLLLNKKFVDPKFWADTNATLKRRDGWSDHASFVVADKTSANDNIIRFQGDLASLDEKGQVLERFQEGDSAFVRGIFPIFDSAHNAVGAMFVVHDISGVYASMRSTENLLVILSIAGLGIGCAVVMLLLNRLVFQRLRKIITVATRVVGGDFNTAIRIDSDDEIGQFEQLFEQFRRVFVDVLSNVPAYEETKAK